ncbi:MAG: 3'-5' exoribonuclease [Flavobacteriaceae bacterium]|jgi:DNA polymerase-3 subunit epsilon|nr:3'-5' exoribonuclease [Flavobacteriaceae bacterium]
MNRFTAIDFETSQPNRISICQVGLVVVEDNKVVEEVSYLVQPPQNIYWEKLTKIHGITAEDTIYAPTFEEVWHKIEPFIQFNHVVAHNGFAFDFPVLAHTLSYYNLAIPEYDKHCTYRLYGKGLAKLAVEHNISLRHHDALSDARACAKLFNMYLQTKDIILK